MQSVVSRSLVMQTLRTIANQQSRLASNLKLCAMNMKMPCGKMIQCLEKIQESRIRKHTSITKGGVDQSMSNVDNPYDKGVTLADLFGQYSLKS